MGGVAAGVDDTGEWEPTWTSTECLNKLSNKAGPKNDSTSLKHTTILPHYSVSSSKYHRDLPHT